MSVRIPYRRDGRRHHVPRGVGVGARRDRREQGIALVMVLTCVAILAVLLADLHESTGTELAVAVAERDGLRAEYMAKSGMNLTRLLVANEPAIRAVVSPLYAAAFGRQPPELPVWNVANALLAPFCNYEATKSADIGVDFSQAEGLGDMPGSCELSAVAENGKININKPLLRDGSAAKKEVALQLFAMMGGYQSPSPYDPLFAERDAEGNFTSRLDIVSSIIDWWDTDSTRTVFDPGAADVTNAGGEDNPYSSYADPYQIKNAPFDSVDELRLVRGVSDDFWATFVEPDPDDPASRRVTIYGSGSVNPNEAPPEVLLARLCSSLGTQPLCVDPMEAAKFIQLLGTIRAMAPIPFFTRSGDFLNFIEGKGGTHDLYPMLKSMLGEDNPLLFKPVVIPDQKTRQQLAGLFVTAAKIITVQSIGVVGKSRVRMRAVLNFHDRWTPPPPNAGVMPRLGVYHHYRID